MSRQRATVDIASVLAAPAEFDALDESLLDAADALLRTRGLRKWSLDDVAKQAGNGRTTVYRRFGSRDALVHAVLARELRSTLDAIGRATVRHDALEDKAVAGVTTALRCLDGSVVDSLLRSDPDTFLPFLTTDAGPLVAIATSAINNALGGHSPELAEAAARIGLSFILTRDSVLPLDKPTQLDASVRRLVRALLT
ncbi:MAG: helix-turn-helix domain-containing protein [Acidimicrobiales bacterium]|nr:helix-turn-helix domain-containing protein [Acidimicrobiales bacterium]